jgi:hypothetical protein
MAVCSAIHMEYKTALYVQKVEFLQLLFHSSSAAMGLGLLIVQVSRSHSIIHTTLGTTHLDKLSALRRNLYLTTHSTHKRQTYMSPRRSSNQQSKQASDGIPTPMLNLVVYKVTTGL